MKEYKKNKSKRRGTVSSGKILKQVVIGKSLAGYIYANGIDVSINNNCFNASLVNHNDEVTIKHKKFGYEIAERTKLGQKQAVMQIHCIDGRWFGYGVNSRIADCVPVAIENEDLIFSGDYAIVELDVAFNGKAKLIEKLPDNEVLFQEKLGEVLYELPTQKFNEDTEQQALSIQQNYALAAKDTPISITHDLPYITIDGENTRDYDDAIWARATATGFDVSIAIADVSHFVEVGSAIDLEAQERGNSYYRPNKVYPMLPWVLSQELCSLKQGEPKHCVVLTVSLAANGEVITRKLHREIVQIKACLSYNEVDEILFNNPQDHQVNVDQDDLKVLNDLAGAAKTLDIKSRQQGEIFVFGNAGEMSAAKIVEKIMILANELTAEMMVNKMQEYQTENIASNAIFRTMPNPNESDWEGIVDAVELMIGRDHGADTSRFTRKSVNDLFAAFTDLPMQLPLITLLIRKLGRAEYTAKPSSHYMLALQKYTHFTSPIRRYIDLCVHRFLLADVKYDNNRRLKHILAKSNDSSFKQKELERFDVSYDLLQLLYKEAKTRDIKYGLFYVSEFRKRWQVTDYGQRYIESEVSGYLLGLLNKNIKPESLVEADSLDLWNDADSKLNQKDVSRLYSTMKVQSNKYTSPERARYYQSIEKNQILLVRFLPESFDVFRGIMSVEPISSMILCDYDIPSNQWLVRSVMK